MTVKILLSHIELLFIGYKILKEHNNVRKSST